MIEHSQKILWSFLSFQEREAIKPIGNINPKKIIGFDTETLGGFAKLLTDNEGRVLEIEPYEIDKILIFLTTPTYRKTLNCFYNLNFDSQVLMKHLPTKEWIELTETGKVEYKNYSILLVPKKFMIITHSETRATKQGKNKGVVKRFTKTYRYYDIAQFFNTTLEKAAEMYLPNTRKETNGLDAALIGESPDYWFKNRGPIVKYCIQDSIVCKALGDLLNDTCINSLNMVPRSFISTASLSKLYFRNRCVFPSLENIPNSAMRYGYESYSGGWFEMIKKGRFEGAIKDDDLNSAYPNAIANFPDISKGDWNFNTSHSIEFDKVDLGFYHVNVDIDSDCLIPPVPLRLKNGKIIHPTGRFSTGMSLREIKSFQEIIDIEIIDGWEFSTDSVIYPFRSEINRLYNLKRKTKEEGRADEFYYTLYKKIPNSFYGNTFHKLSLDMDDPLRYNNSTHKVGPMFNPIMASFITSECRVDIADAIRGREDNIIAIATDGIISEGGLGHENSLDLGAWEIKHSKELIMFQPGIYALDGNIKTRGMERKKPILTASGKSYPSIFDYIKAEPEKTDYDFQVTRVVGSKEALHTKRYSQDDVGIFKQKTITKNINSDEKRHWFDTFKNGADLLTRNISSKPFHLLD